MNAGTMAPVREQIAPDAMDPDIHDSPAQDADSRHADDNAPGKARAKATAAASVLKVGSETVNTVTTTVPPVISAKYKEMPLPDLRDGIKSENSKAVTMAKKSLGHIRVCGEMLIAFKLRIPHGLWMGEVMLLGMSQKCATNYMSIARNWQLVANSSKGVKDAFRLLSRQDSPVSRPSPQPVPSPAIVTIEEEITSPSPQPVAKVRLPCGEETEPVDAVATSLIQESSPEFYDHVAPDEPDCVVMTNLINFEVLPKEAVGTAEPQADESSIAYDQILGLLPILTKDQLLELTKTIATRWT